MPHAGEAAPRVHLLQKWQQIGIGQDGAVVRVADDVRQVLGESLRFRVCRTRPVQGTAQ